MLEILGAEGQQPVDGKAQVAAVRREVVHHQGGIVQYAGGAGGHRLPVEVGGAVGVHHLGGGRLVQPGGVVGRIGPAAQGKPEVQRGGIPHPHLQRGAGLLHLLQLLGGVFLPVDRQGDGPDVAHQVDLPPVGGAVPRVGIGVVGGLRPGGQRAKPAQQPQNRQRQHRLQGAPATICRFHSSSPTLSALGPSSSVVSCSSLIQGVWRSAALTAPGCSAPSPEPGRCSCR